MWHHKEGEPVHWALGVCKIKIKVFKFTVQSVSPLPCLFYISVHNCKVLE